MLRLVVACLGAAALLSGCQKSQFTAHEGQRCSTSSGEEPFYACAKTFDYVCINTFGVDITDPDEARKWDGGVRPIYLCRFACDPGVPATCTAGTVCCPGPIHGVDFGKTGGCTPAQFCDFKADAGAGDTTKRDGGQVDGQVDGAGQDADADAPEAPVDAPADTDSVDSGG